MTEDAGRKKPASVKDVEKKKTSKEKKPLTIGEGVAFMCMGGQVVSYGCDTALSSRSCCAGRGDGVAIRCFLYL